MNIKLKEIILDKLDEDLKHVEVIPYDESIWIVNEDLTDWYFKFSDDGILFLKNKFFVNFFYMFNMTIDDFEPILIEWVRKKLDEEITIEFVLTCDALPFFEELAINEKSNEK